MKSELTELEGAVLAVIGQQGPLTAYAVKEAFRTSPSGFWSGSAGAVYPLTRRLAERDLLAAAETVTGRRKSLAYDLTKAGRAALINWIADTNRAVNMGYDPLRTRLQFLDALPSERQAAFLDEVEAGLMSPAPPPGADERLTRLHEIWLKGRRDWFRHFRKPRT